MAEYIDRDYVLKLLGVFNDRVNGDYHFMNGIETAKEIVEDAPSADVQPVKHGRWINICGDSESMRQCSECLQDFDYIDGICYLVSGQRLPLYCPNCGARMDGET